jgi:hypothetical protein
MGFAKRWDISDIVNQLHRAELEMNSRYNDGYTAWNCKQELYQVKFILDEIMKSAPSFGTTEQEWLEEQAKRQVWSILNDKM